MALLTEIDLGIQVGKSFLKTAKNIFKKDIKPLIGPFVYRYVDHPMGWFAIATGQHFGSASSVLTLYKSFHNENRSNPTDGLIYLAESKRFAGYRLVDGKLFDANIISFGIFVSSEAERISLKKKGLISEIPVRTVSVPTEEKTTDDSVIKSTDKEDGGFDATKLIVPAVGIALLLLRK